VVAATPYLTSEVMIASPSNLSGVIIKGIDPRTIGRVTELVNNTQQGSLDNLLHPERMRLLGSGSAVDPEKPPKKPDEKPGGKSALQALPEPEAAADGSPPKAQAPAQPTDKKPTDKKDTSAKSDAKNDPADDKELAPEPKPRSERKILQGVVIGRELAKNLRVFVGDDVSVVSPMGDIGPTGPIPKAKPYRTAAIFFSGMYEYDSKYVYMDLPAAQKFLGLADEVTGLELKLNSPEESGPMMARVQAALGSGGFEVADGKELNRSLFSALKLEKIAMFIALCFIIVVAAFSIVSNGIMLVLEKGREVAILKSMGASDRAIQRIFVLLGLYMGVLGTTFGVLTGCAVCWALDHFGLPLDTDVYYITKLPVNVNPAELLAVLLASLLLSLLATLYPARLAAQLRPVQGLR
jgi:lipoprotein-releasing system permease protein